MTAAISEDCVPATTEPNATPTASPSGILCRVTAAVKRKPLLLRAFLKVFIRFITISDTTMKAPPAKKPMVSMGAGLRPVLSQFSIAGIRREKKLAAIIMPPASPIITVKTL